MKILLLLTFLIVSCGKVDTTVPVVGREYIIPTDLVLSNDDKVKVVNVCNALIAKKQSFLSTSRIFHFDIGKKSCANEITPEKAELMVVNDTSLRFTGTNDNLSQNFFRDVVTKDHDAMYFLCNQMNNASINKVNNLTSQLKVVYEIDNNYCSGNVNGKVCIHKITILNSDPVKEKYMVINTEKMLIETRPDQLNRGVIVHRHREEECVETGKVLSLKSVLTD